MTFQPAPARVLKSHVSPTREREITKDHGPSIKDDDQYEALREEGMSKEKAARIANTPRTVAGRRGGEAHPTTSGQRTISAHELERSGWREGPTPMDFLSERDGERTSSLIELEDGADLDLEVVEKTIAGRVEELQAALGQGKYGRVRSRYRPTRN